MHWFDFCVFFSWKRLKNLNKKVSYMLKKMIDVHVNVNITCNHKAVFVHEEFNVCILWSYLIKWWSMIIICRQKKKKERGENEILANQVLQAMGWKHFDVTLVVSLDQVKITATKMQRVKNINLPIRSGSGEWERQKVVTLTIGWMKN